MLLAIARPIVKKSHNLIHVKSILKIKTDKEVSKKILKHISDSGTLGLALGVMGAFLGLISAFDILEASGAAEPAIIAGGLKELYYPLYLDFLLFRFLN